MLFDVGSTEDKKTYLDLPVSNVEMESGALGGVE